MTEERKNEIWAMLTPEEKSKMSQLYANYSRTTEPSFVGFNLALIEIFGEQNLVAKADELKFKVGDKVIFTEKCGLIPKGTIGEITYVRAQPTEYYWVELENCEYAQSTAEPECLALYEEPKFKVGDKVLYNGGEYTVKACDGKGRCTITSTHGWIILEVDEGYLTPRPSGEQKEADAGDAKISDENSRNTLNVAESDKISTKEDAYSDPNEESGADKASDKTLNEFQESFHDMVKRDGFHVSPSGEAIIRHDADYAQYRLDITKELAVAMLPDGWNIDIAKRSVDLANYIVKRLKETEE